jgi:hypothetical protein
MGITLYHFSDRDDIAVFKPRAPLRHPHAEPLVYAIDEWHSPLYFFPRDCPRIAVWPVETSSPEDVSKYRALTDKRMLMFVEENPSGELFRYEMDPLDGFQNTGDIGVWISRQDVIPLYMTRLNDLAEESVKANVEVVVVESLLDTAKRFFDFENRVFTTSLHVSMIRTSAIPTWPIPVTKPRFSK